MLDFPEGTEASKINEGSTLILSTGDFAEVDSIMHAVWGSFTAIREIAT